MALSHDQQQDLWTMAHEASTKLHDIARELEMARHDELSAEASKLNNDLVIFAAKINPTKKPLQHL